MMKTRNLIFDSYIALCCVSNVPCAYTRMYTYTYVRTVPGEVKRTVNFCYPFCTILISQVNYYKLKYHLRLYPISNMNGIKIIQIIVSESKGE